jgi:hypothetical protein
MSDGLERDEAALDLRVSDDDRESVADVLRRQTTAGRLTLGELEERLGEVYAARTARQLEHALRELPVEPRPIVPGRRSDGSELPIAEGDLRRRYRRRLRNEAAGLFVPNFVCNFIWLMAGAGYWWPGWVLMGTSIGLISTVVRGFDPEKERAALAARQRKQARAEIEGRHAAADEPDS